MWHPLNEMFDVCDSLGRMNRSMRRSDWFDFVLILIAVFLLRYGRHRTRSETFSETQNRFLRLVAGPAVAGRCRKGKRKIFKNIRSCRQFDGKVSCLSK